MTTGIQYWRTLMGAKSREYLLDAFDHEMISMGPLTEQFEERVGKLLAVPYVLAVPSGSVALYMAMQALGVAPGDEVIVPNRTFHATAHAAMLCGATIRLVDVEQAKPVIDPTKIEEAITPATKAVCAVHLNGRAADMPQILTLAKKHSLSVIEDAAQALYSKGGAGYLGTQGNIGAFSLGMTKLISTGQGGLVVTHSAETYERLKYFRNHGVRDTANADFTQLGFNFKFTDIQAALGMGQLDMLEEKIKHLNTIQSYYEEELSSIKGISIIPVQYENGEVPLWVEVLSPERDACRSFLAEHGIGTRKILPSLQYAPHICRQPAQTFQNSEIFHKQGFYLPCGPGQPLENCQKTVKLLREFYSKKINS